MPDVVDFPDGRILIVDDDALVRDVLGRILTRERYSCLHAANAAQTWEVLSRHDVDVITLDISMPGDDGLDLLSELGRCFPEVAVIMVTGQGAGDAAIQALNRGATGYLTKPVDAETLRYQVRRGVARRRLLIEKRRHLHRLEETIREQTRMIRRAHEETIHRLVSASMYRDEETGAHVRRVGLYSELLAKVVGMTPREQDDIRLAAPMHDVGKIGIPDAILRKPGRLTQPELEIMRSHTTIGARMLEGSDSPMLRMAQQIALSHHEKWDGSGYPEGRRGTDIPIAARIVAICDVFDALSHDRIYRPAFPAPEVERMLREGRGTQFDPDLLDAFMDLLPVMRGIADANRDDAPLPSSPIMSVPVPNAAAGLEDLAAHSDHYVRDI